MTHQGPFSFIAAPTGVIVRCCNACGAAWEKVDMEIGGEKDSDPTTLEAVWQAVGEFDAKNNTIYYRAHECVKQDKQTEQKRDTSTSSNSGRAVVRR